MSGRAIPRPSAKKAAHDPQQVIDVLWSIFQALDEATTNHPVNGYVRKRVEEARQIFEGWL